MLSGGKMMDYGKFYSNITAKNESTFSVNKLDTSWK